MDLEELTTAVLALFPALSDKEQRISLALYRLLAEGSPVSLPELGAATGTTHAQLEAILSRWTAVYRDKEGRIIGYAGLTVVPTQHRMRIGARALHTWCAWDTLFLPALLGATAEVASACAVSGAPISITVPPDRAPAGNVFLSLVAPNREKAAADIVSHFCCHVQFLADARAADAWSAKHPAARIATLGQAWQLGRRRNELLYPAMQT